MVAKKFWEKPIAEFINLVKQESENKCTEICGSNFHVLPGVFSPIYSSDTAWFAEKVVPLTKNKKFLEIGSGAGVIACLASLNGASQVVATDINPTAVKNIKLNAKSYSLNLDVRKGSVFEPIKQNELFDIIFWNHPFYNSKDLYSQDDMLLLSVHDPNYKYLKIFFDKGKNFLAKNGQLILGTSNVGSLNLIKKIAKNHNYNISLLDKLDVPIYKNKKTKMDIRIYSFKNKL